MKTRKLISRTLWIAGILFLLMNIMAFFHAWKFTHFADAATTKTKEAKELSLGAKLKTLFTGVNNPRPENSTEPSQAYSIVTLQSNVKIQCWQIKALNAKGTIILCHGFGGAKSSLLQQSDIFLSRGYNTLLVDFMGSGGSEGNQTTIGYKEAGEIKTCYDYLVKSGERNIYLFGNSMGSAAILKAVHDYKMELSGIIIECPFGSLYQATCQRFKAMKVPSFPMAGLLVFWGGIQSGYWGFSHRPSEYARSVQCPTLIMYGEKDIKVGREETDAIFSNLKGPKRLKTFSDAGHENYLVKYEKEWTKSVTDFLTMAQGMKTH